MRYRIFSAVLVTASFVVACATQDAPPEPNEALKGPSLNFDNGPDNPGPIVMRSEVTFAVFYVDPETGRSAVHGADIVEFCQGTIDFDLVDLQRIDVPEDANRVNDILQGDDVTTSVWPFTTFDCGLFTTVTPLATGTADVVLTDNDVFVFLNPESTNSNAFGFRARGALADSDGDKVQFSGHCNCVWDGNDIETLRCNDKVNVS